MNPELIRFARKHRYEIAEGFCAEGKEAEELQNEVSESLEKLLPNQQEFLDDLAEELSVHAGISLDEAESALANWILLLYLQKFKADGD
ncbi:MAG: hypothetical protein WDM76_11790 [Limisphaerales bacterium]